MPTGDELWASYGYTPKTADWKKARHLRNLQSLVNKPLDSGLLSEPTYALDNETRGEISALAAGGHYTAAKQLYNTAFEGVDPKFKARQATQHMYETLLDQPGQAQTRNASLLDAYKGKI